MAKRGSSVSMDIEYLEDFTIEAAPRMVEAGVRILEAEVRASLSRVLSGRSSGGLFRSVSASHTFIENNATRFRANVFFKGADGVNHGHKAAFLEYGATRAKRGVMEATHFAESALRSAEGRVVEEMERVLTAAVGG